MCITKKDLYPFFCHTKSYTFGNLVNKIQYRPCSILSLSKGSCRHGYETNPIDGFFIMRLKPLLQLLWNFLGLFLLTLDIFSRKFSDKFLESIACAIIDADTSWFLMHQSSTEEMVGLLNLHSETNPPVHSRRCCILNLVLVKIRWAYKLFRAIYSAWPQMGLDV